jgi:uncharacterized protein YbcC (UPF0753/DUF2309 family)
MTNYTEKNSDFGPVKGAIRQACERIAPAWPLDKSIAVNPWWQMRQKKISDVAEELAVLGKINCLMPHNYYHVLWQTQIKPVHLTAALQALDMEAEQAELLSFLDTSQPSGHWLNVCDWLDAQPGNRHKMAWHDEIIHQISQFCALYCQYPQWMNYPDNAENGFYRNWLTVIQQDRGIAILTAEPSLHPLFLELPESITEVFEYAYAELCPEGTNAAVFADYCYALLLDIHGWASWAAYQAWQDNFESKTNHLLEQLLAVRMAWDWLLWRHTKTKDPKTFNNVGKRFANQFAGIEIHRIQWRNTQRYLWVWQRALEFSFQLPLQRKLLSLPIIESSPPKLQAFFCIDVRSEPFRRALEAQDPAIQTYGFAGFFGLPIEYATTASAASRPQLPGLLKASIQAIPVDGDGHMQSSINTAKDQVFWNQSGDVSPANLGFVEAKGLWKSFDLLKNSLFPSVPMHSINHIAHNGNWCLVRNGNALNTAEQAELAAGILGAMGLTKNFAETVLLIGHGSCSANNPQAAGLDCGACGGQTGEINAKVLAQLLNDNGVRAELRKFAIDIPASTQFVAGLHNTTTDELDCFGQTDQRHAYWQGWLDNATKQAREQRLSSLCAETESDIPAAKFYREKSQDWGQVRPEWGLSNNAAFIVAPRARTRHLNLEGRCFLHDYQSETDKDYGILELIMTAPMVVTNWINLQYYASVTDNLKYGSGNKLLHNVVGGNIGVFEGNGGDLRIGLARQSLHDGQNWRHQPLRLSVYIAAPRAAMTAIIHKHEHIADLINNQWLFLFQLDVASNSIWQFQDNHWRQTVAEEG